MRRVAVLCAPRNSVYHTLPTVDVYDVLRDARMFQGGMPIVAHPPCRAWSAYCAHQAKPLPGEKELGLWCCEMLKQCGGVLEQPAHSRLFEAGGLPLPPSGDAVLWSQQVDQWWWGDSRKKSTWLCFSGIPRESVAVPYALRATDTGDKRRWQVMSHNQRSATPVAFAAWLVAIARASMKDGGEKGWACA